MIEITINKADATVSQLETLVCGMVNMVQIHFTLSEHWAGLHKTAVFTNGQITIDVMESEWLTPDTCVLPPEMVAIPGKKVSVGLRGQASAETGVDILPSTLCNLGAVKPGPTAQADTGTQPSLPIWGQLQEQVTALRKDASRCYTTLTRPKTGEDGNDLLLRVNLHNISRLSGDLALHVYVCMRRRKKAYYWRHPDNWDAEGKGVVKMGYGQIAGKVFANSDLDDAPQYPAVPAWMPNEGFLETVLPVSKRLHKHGFITIDLSNWLLPLLKPVDEEEFTWSACGLMGLQGDGSVAPLLFQFRLTENGIPVGTAQNTLAIGVRRELSEEAKCLTANNTVDGSSLYLSIR